jgi:hypothetical protein
MKREVMLTAWRIFREDSGSFSEALKRAWALVKRLYNFITKTRMTQEKADYLMGKKFFRRAANHSTSSLNLIYKGERKLTHKYNLWIKHGKVRFYVNSFVDGIEYRQLYIETKEESVCVKEMSI